MSKFLLKTIIMHKYLFVAYRDWAIKSHGQIGLQLPLVSTTQALNQYIKSNNQLKYIFFVGWSEIIDIDILDKYYCLCIHPSNLPFYRGGSPIQNQIIDGIEDSRVTLFKMDEKIDSGPIIDQRFLSLNGNLDEIFNRISTLSSDLIWSFIDKIENSAEILLKLQDHQSATFFKRRKPSESQITLDELKNLTALQLYNKIRCLDDPYPNAYIQCSDGKKLYIKKATLE
jgi:methionyl-tRNA formyltransferase